MKCSRGSMPVFLKETHGAQVEGSSRFQNGLDQLSSSLYYFTQFFSLIATIPHLPLGDLLSDIWNLASLFLWRMWFWWVNNCSLFSPDPRDLWVFIFRDAEKLAKSSGLRMGWIWDWLSWFCYLRALVEYKGPMGTKERGLGHLYSRNLRTSL